jgi:hypothetical protein
MRPSHVPRWEALDVGRGLPKEGRPAMRFTIEHSAGHLRGDLYNRHTADETREFLQALLGEALGSGMDRVLVSVHSSRAIFRAEGWGLSEFMKAVAARPGHRVAAVADNYEGRLAQRYVATLARLRGLNVASFDHEREAVAWLHA